MSLFSGALLRKLGYAVLVGADDRPDGLGAAQGIFRSPAERAGCHVVFIGDVPRAI